ncbi:MAG: Ig-like domain-containing protein, partial [Eubacterium sp.]
NKYAAADNSFDFSEILPKKDNYSFKVFAVGDGKTTLNSAHSAESPVFSFTGPYVYKVSITTPPGTLKKGSTQQLTAALQGVGAFNEAVIWSISGQNNADTKILPDGTLNIAQNETAAMITVKAASVSNTDQYAEADIQLEDIPKLALPEELKWSDKTAVWKAVDGAKGYSLTLYKNREAVGSDVTAAEATYNFEETIKKTGAGDYTFRVTAQGDGVNALDSDPVESPVYNYKETPTVESVTVTPSTATLKKGETQEFTAVVNGKNTPSQEVEWTLEGQK